jgi:hypothetical protein
MIIHYVLPKKFESLAPKYTALIHPFVFVGE